MLVLLAMAMAAFETAHAAPADHWSFQPVTRPDPPALDDAGWARGPIDLFILQRLRQEGLEPSREADRRTLLRRLKLSLVGLPPTPEETERFLQDPRADAYERCVDDLLASPRYGEKWARHWLDAIAFGETHGFEVNTPRQNAWPYRDYVIAAFNEDKPYPEFIRDQLAGDVAGADAATGFLVARAALLQGQIGKDEESMRQARQDELADMVQAVGGAFLGLTVSCARCHDHKFDPVSQHDYYAMAAVFAGVRHGERPLREAKAEEEARGGEALRLQQRLDELEDAISTLIRDGDGNSPRRPPPNARINEETLPSVTARRVRFTIHDANHHPSLGLIEPCIDELEVFTDEETPRNLALASSGAKVTASGSRTSDIHRLEHIHDGLYGNSHSWMSDEAGRGWVILEWAEPTRIHRIVWSRDREGQFTDRLATEYVIEVQEQDEPWRTVASSRDREPYDTLQRLKVLVAAGTLDKVKADLARRWMEEKKELETRLAALNQRPMVYAGRFTDPDPTFLLNRGDPMQRLEPIAPGAVTSVPPGWHLDEQAAERERREALATWIAHPANPLPARVLVNRLWQHLFGEGLVSTPSDFGRNGARPTHPRLLDWLASEFVAQGWRIKAMQRQIVLSAAFRQSSRPRPEALAVDAGSRLLWRYPPHRLDAEPIRDAMLKVAGTLDLRMGGPGYSVFAPNDNYVRVYDPKETFGADEWRRMIYMTKVRMEQDATFGVFDCPDAGQCQPKRARSTTPLQSLSLFNSVFVTDQAERLADRLEAEAGPAAAEQVNRAFQLCFNRLPDETELDVCETLVRDHGLPALARVLFNANEFVFIP